MKKTKTPKQFPVTDDPIVLRTDFSNPAAWEKICATIREPVKDFYANVEFVDDPQFEGVTNNELLRLVPEGYLHSFLIVVDETAASQSDHPLLVVDLIEEPGREFRAIPSQIQAIENSLSGANMGFEEFAESVDQDGVFRGFPEP
jgi:hypothetical protein